MNDDSVGDVMGEGNSSALKALAVFASVIVYLGMIVYSGVHNWRLMTVGVPAEMIIWAALGVVALEISALALPVALHWWTYAPMQRIAAFAFYGLDLALIFCNVVLDYSRTTGSVLPDWMNAYLFFGVPATPVFCGLGWSLLWLLDPSQQERGMIETLRASTRVVLAKRIAAQAKASDISEAVDVAAANMARDIVGATLGVSTRRQLPTKTVESKARQPITASNNGHRPEMTAYPAETVLPVTQSELPVTDDVLLANTLPVTQEQATPLSSSQKR